MECKCQKKKKKSHRRFRLWPPLRDIHLGRWHRIRLQTHRLSCNIRLLWMSHRLLSQQKRGCRDKICDHQHINYTSTQAALPPTLAVSHAEATGRCEMSPWGWNNSKQLLQGWWTLSQTVEINFFATLWRDFFLPNWSSCICLLNSFMNT